jgi:kynurenine formamidase
MKIIDLSQNLFDKMPVFPGDPEVIIKEIHTLDKEGWNLRNMTLTTHIGTHVNVPYHMVKDGKNLDQFYIDSFFGKSELYKAGMKFYHNKGVIFSSCNIDMKIANELIKFPPKFIGLSEKFEFDVLIEKLLLEKGIISFENLTNTEKLPELFTFYGVPLNIKEADGSPVRAFAIT